MIVVSVERHESLCTSQGVLMVEINVVKLCSWVVFGYAFFWSAIAVAVALVLYNSSRTKKAIKEK